MTSRPARPCVHHLVADQARRTPDAVAVRFEAASLTYAQLDARANRLAHRLRSVGVGPDVLVGLFVGRSLDLPVALLGILKAGGAYVPIDPGWPAPRVEFMLRDSGTPALVTEVGVAERLPSHEAALVLMDAEWPEDPRVPGEPDTGVGLEHLAYVIYTSGSTGRPKGVMMPHASARNGLDYMQGMLGLSAHDVVLGVASAAVDMAWLDVCLPLAVGAQVVVVSDEDVMFGRRIAGRLEETGATFLEATPVTWRMLLDAGWTGSSRLQMLSSGEILTPDLAGALLARGARLWNGYGATEGGIYTTMHQVRPGEAPVPIGRPITNMRVHLLDESGSSVAEEGEGEIHAAGVGVARGYLHRPELTAERFVPDPFSDEPDARMYRTGDLARRRRDGVLEYIGRADHQIKLRGFRIEPGEVEGTLTGHPAVRQAVVIAREDEPGDRCLVAYAVLTKGRSARPLELRRYLKDRLPSHMVPTDVVILSELPLTPSRKVDRLALPPP